MTTQPPSGPASAENDPSSFEARATMLSAALRETRDIVAAALGDERQRTLYATGAAMTTDDAIASAVWALAPGFSPACPSMQIERKVICLRVRCAHDGRRP